jgi:hypothetical protein
MSNVGHTKMKYILAIIITLITTCICNAATSAIPSNIETNEGLKPYSEIIRQLISNKSENSTSTLAATLTVLHSKDLYTHNLTYRCRQVREGMFAMLEESKVDAPRKYELFTKIKDELIKREEKVVVETFKPMLTAGILKEKDKEEIRNYIRKTAGEDVPFSLPANDKSQERDMLLLFTPTQSRTVIVKSGDVLERIAINEYPKLSKHSSTEIIAFINNFKNRDSIQVGQKLKIYRYEIIDDQLAEWAKNKQTGQPVN